MEQRVISRSPAFVLVLVDASMFFLVVYRERGKCLSEHPTSCFWESCFLLLCLLDAWYVSRKNVWSWQFVGMSFSVP